MQENLQTGDMEKMRKYSIFCRRAVGHTRMSSETFKIRVGCRIVSYCEELSKILQDVCHTWLSYTKCQWHPLLPTVTGQP